MLSGIPFRHRFLESGVLSLQILHALRLVAAQAAVALAPAKVRLVRDPRLLADLGDRLALAAHDVGLAQLVNNLLGRKPLFRHDPLTLRSSIARNIRLDQEFQVRSPLDRHNPQSVMGSMSYAIVHSS